MILVLLRYRKQKHDEKNIYNISFTFTDSKFNISKYKYET